MKATSRKKAMSRSARSASRTSAATSPKRTKAEADPRSLPDKLRQRARGERPVCSSDLVETRPQPVEKVIELHLIGRAERMQRARIEGPDRALHLFPYPAALDRQTDEAVATVFGIFGSLDP